MTQTNFDPRAVAVGYIGRGWSPIHVPFMQKGPRLDDWQLLRIDLEDVESYFGGKRLNVGVILGPASGGLTDVDLDCREARAAASFFLPKTAAIFGRKSTRMAHWLYRTDLASRGIGATMAFKDPRPREGLKPTILELRIGGDKGAQTVFPGSTHESGEAIEWERGCDGEPAAVDGEDLWRRAGRLAACALLARYWPPHGARHDARLALAGVLARAGFSETEANLFVEALAHAHGDEDVRDAKAAVRSTFSKRHDDPCAALPKLCEAVGDEIGRLAADWLGYDETSPEWGAPAQEARSEPRERAPLPDRQEIRAEAEGELAARGAPATSQDPLAGVVFDGDDAAIEPPRMLVKRLVPAEGICFVGGQSGAGKTFVAVDLAVSLASGEPFFGHKIAERVGVVILAAEGSGTIGMRVHVARNEKALGEILPIAWLGSVPSLSDTKEFPSLVARLQAIGERFRASHGVRLGAIIVDTIAAACDMKDENDNAEASRVIRQLNAIARAIGAVILPVHHYGKGQETGLRGASAWRAGADTVLSVIAERNEITGHVAGRRLALAKSRCDEEGPIAAFELRFVKVGEDEDGEDVGACVVEPSAADPGATETGKAARPSRAMRAYLEALQTALLGECKEKIRPFGSEGSEVTAVDREAVRAEFYRAWPADGDTEAKRAEVRRKRFRAGELEAIDRRLIATAELGGKQFVWSAKA